VQDAGNDLTRELVVLLLCCAACSLLPRDAGAQMIHGKLSVSVTVLLSCEVITSRPSTEIEPVDTVYGDDVIEVNCSYDYPFRASLDYGAEPQFRKPVEGRGLRFAGAPHVDLRQLAATGARGIPFDRLILTIYY